jgi:uncharacterized protein (UPF0248 family)
VVHPLKNVLNKLRWDQRERADEYLITYRHRGAPNDTRQVRASRIRKLGNSFFTLAGESDSEETIIPFHRVLEIRNLQEGVVVWRGRKATG